MSLFGYMLWIAGPILQGLMSVRMTRRRLHAEFPLFFSYTVFHVARFLTLFAIYHWPNAFRIYFVCFWVCDVVDIALQLAVIYELYSHVFGQYEGLRDLGALLFRWSAAVLVLVAALTAAAAPGSDSDRFVAGIFVLARSAAVVKGGLLLLLFAFANSFGLAWRHYLFGVALGLALFTSVDLAAIAIRTQLGAVADHTYSIVRSAAYNCSILIWVTYTFRRQPAQQAATSVPGNDLARWNAALLEFLHR